MLFIGCIAITDDKISYRSLPYIFLPVLLFFGILFLLEKINKKYNFNQKLKIHSLLIILFIIPLIFLTIKTPPLKNDFTRNDILKPAKNATESYSSLQKLAKMNINCSFTNIPFDAFKSNTFAYTDIMEAAWTNNHEARNLINILNSYDGISDQSVGLDEYDKTLDSLSAISKLYTRYARLKIKQNNFITASKSLLAMNSLSKKAYPYAGNWLQFILTTVDRRTIETMEILTENTNCHPEIIAKIQKSIVIIQPNIKKWSNNEYISYKSFLDKYISSLENHSNRVLGFSFKISTYLLTDKNKSCKNEKTALDLFFGGITNQPPSFLAYDEYMKKYKSNVQYNNIVGWAMINGYNSSFSNIYETIIKQIKKRNTIVEKINKL